MTTRCLRIKHFGFSIVPVVSCSCRHLILIHLIILFTGTDVCSIIQVSAICDERIFNGYTVPVRRIRPEATNITGFTVHNSRLYRHGHLMSTIPLRDLLIHFISYLAQFYHPILVAHNAKWFDVPVLMRVLAENSLLQEFKQRVHGFLDTLPLCRHIYPNLRRYSLKDLADHFLGEEFDAHNGVEDANVLRKLFHIWNPSDGYIQMCFFSP